jgi:hypothetical protein
LNFGLIIWLSFAVLILYCAIFGGYNVLPKLLHDLGFNNLGFYNLSLLYLSAALTTFIVPLFMKYMKSYNALSLATFIGIPNFLMILCAAYKYEHPKSGVFLLNYTFIYVLTLLTSIIGGLGFSIGLVVTGVYISKCASI